jgi:hypothetical protein
MSNLVSVLRRLILAASFVAVSIGQVSPGYACSSMPGKPVPTEEELFSQASSVFVAHLTSVEEIAAPDDMKRFLKNIIEGSFSTIERIKGEPPASRKVRSAPYAFGNCTIPFMAGADYIFFLQKEDDYITFLSGSAGPFINLDGTKVRERLEKLRALAK